jgi:RNA 3'-terminal phosphate cyclase (ATP)
MLLPVAAFAREDTVFESKGGLFQDYAPSALHMQNVLFPMLGRMGMDASMTIVKPGYVPGGGGEIRVRVGPCKERLSPIRLGEQGSVVTVKGVALSSHLKEQEVSRRMAEQCRDVLAGRGLRARIDVVEDETAPSPGASLAVWAETDTGCIIGSDQAGKRGRRSEAIGEYVANELLADLSTGATTDRYLADQLVIYAALADGVSEYIMPALTDHVDANLWIVEEFGARTRLESNRLLIEGIGHRNRAGAATRK